MKARPVIMNNSYMNIKDTIVFKHNLKCSQPYDIVCKLNKIARTKCGESPHRLLKKLNPITMNVPREEARALR